MRQAGNALLALAALLFLLPVLHAATQEDPRPFPVPEIGGEEIRAVLEAPPGPPHAPRDLNPAAMQESFQEAAWRLRTANAEQCTGRYRGASPGFTVQSKTWRDAPAVTHLIADGPAARGGLQAGDQTQAFGEFEIRPWHTRVRILREVRDRSLAALESGTPLKIRILRNGEEQTLEIRPVPACRIDIRFLQNEEEQEAYYRHWMKDIFLSAGMIRTTESQDQLLAVLGHELAHALLRHTRKPWGSATRMRKQELEADVYGLQLALAAGARPEAAIRFWKNALLSSRERKDQKWIAERIATLQKFTN